MSKFLILCCLTAHLSSSFSSTRILCINSLTSFRAPQEPRSLSIERRRVGSIIEQYLWDTLCISGTPKNIFLLDIHSLLENRPDDSFATGLQAPRALLRWFVRQRLCSLLIDVQIMVTDSKLLTVRYSTRRPPIISAICRPRCLVRVA